MLVWSATKTKAAQHIFLPNRESNMSTEPILFGHGSNLDVSPQRHHGALEREDSRFQNTSGPNTPHAKSKLGYPNGEGIQDAFEMEDLSKYAQRSGVASSGDCDEEGSDKESFQVDHRDSELIDPSFMLYTPDEERSVIKAFDRRLVLFIALLYMLSFLDRSSMLQLPPA